MCFAAVGGRVSRPRRDFNNALDTKVYLGLQLVCAGLGGVFVLALYLWMAAVPSIISQNINHYWHVRLSV